MESIPFIINSVLIKLNFCIRFKILKIFINLSIFPALHSVILLVQYLYCTNKITECKKTFLEAVDVEDLWFTGKEMIGLTLRTITINETIILSMYFPSHIDYLNIELLADWLV